MVATTTAPITPSAIIFFLLLLIINFSSLLYVNNYTPPHIWYVKGFERKKFFSFFDKSAIPSYIQFYGENIRYFSYEKIYFNFWFMKLTKGGNLYRTFYIGYLTWQNRCDLLNFLLFLIVVLFLEKSLEGRSHVLMRLWIWQLYWSTKNIYIYIFYLILA